MPRKRSAKVDYFPHVVRHGRTMKIMEKKYGDAGYAFWFRLLELLGDTDGHCYRTEDQSDIEYLQTLCLTEGISVTDMLGDLAVLGAIDKPLWMLGVIWSDNFVNGLTPVYDKRIDDLPLKPGISGDIRPGYPQGEGVSGPDIPSEGVYPGISGEVIPRGKERKGQLVKEKKEKSPLTNGSAVDKWEPDSVEARTWKAFEVEYAAFIPDHTKHIDAVSKLKYLAEKTNEDPEIVIPAMMEKLKDLKESDNTKKGFWKNQPFLPATLVSLWTQVREQIKESVYEPIDWETIDENAI